MEIVYNNIDEDVEKVKESQENENTQLFMNKEEVINLKVEYLRPREGYKKTKGLIF